MQREYLPGKRDTAITQNESLVAEAGQPSLCCFYHITPHTHTHAHTHAHTHTRTHTQLDKT